MELETEVASDTTVNLGLLSSVFEILFRGEHFATDRASTLAHRLHELAAQAEAVAAGTPTDGTSQPHGRHKKRKAGAAGSTDYSSWDSESDGYTGSRPVALQLACLLQPRRPPPREHT